MKIALLKAAGAGLCLAALSLPAHAASVGNYFLLFTGDIKSPLSKGESVICAAYAYLVPGNPPTVGGPNSVLQVGTVIEGGKRYACQLVMPYAHATPADGRQLAIGYSVTKATLSAGVGPTAPDPKSFKEVQFPAAPSGPQLLPMIKEDLQ